ncbi:MAG: hypothetical protein AAFS10_08825, partial [Myxococcota bacterium]
SDTCRAAMINRHGQEKWDRAVAQQEELDANGGVQGQETRTAEQIEALRSRTECAMELYTQHYDDLSEPNQIALWDYLVENFAYTEEFNIFNEVEVRRGFEFLDVELAIMLGDESYTRALASRFDLAELQVASFEGALFEEGGINISGMAGAEMVNLYQAVQYYQMGLDRFYDISPLIAWSVEMDLQPGGPPSFITQAAVESYFGRLIRASTQKAKAWAEIARRYQNFNRPDLARRVIERAYTAAYLESVVLTRLMQDIITITTPEGVTPIIRQIDDAQRSYRIALASMQRDYADISDDINYFGYAPDYIPFPALEHYRDASVEVALTRARSRVELAQTAEVQALEADQRYNTDAANFQNELTRIQNTYDSQLAELCGTFEADGQIYPATTKYAYLSPETLRIGDPCGRVQTGQISTAYGQMDILLTELRRVRQAMSNTLNEAQIEQARWNASCRANNSFARMQYEVSGEINTVQSAIDSTRSAIAGVDRAIQDVSTISQLSKCSVIGGLAVGGSCGSSAVATGLYTTAFVAYEAARIGLDVGLNALETEVRELQRGIELERSLLQCDLIAIDGQARVQTILLRLAELELDALKIEYEINQAISNINQLRNQATRLQQEMAEVEEQAINVEAARNNPNIRIYRNDAVLNADTTFYSALREVYKATRVFEYYTSQSYAPLEQLFLTRMVTRGDFNLQLYLVALEDAFRDFEDLYGLPQRRLAILSLKDDILAIPHLDPTAGHVALTSPERTARFRDKLKDRALLDANGYITIPFSTSMDALSPLTRNHKIASIEAEIIGGGQGDLLARLYLRMAGTATVTPLGSRGVEDTRAYTFPERLAVLNPFFEGTKPSFIDPAIYSNRRMFDRPFVNSRWELVLNTFDEEVNQDLNLDGLDDVRLYIYYNDFTEF